MWCGAQTRHTWRHTNDACRNTTNSSWPGNQTCRPLTCQQYLRCCLGPAESVVSGAAQIGQRGGDNWKTEEDWNCLDPYFLLGTLVERLNNHHREVASMRITLKYKASPVHKDHSFHKPLRSRTRTRVCWTIDNPKSAQVAASSFFRLVSSTV